MKCDSCFYWDCCPVFLVSKCALIFLSLLLISKEERKYILFMVLLLSCVSCVRLCATPQTVAHQAPPSLGFSRQEHWSGLPFPSSMHESEKWKWIRSVVLTLRDPMDCSPPGSSVHGIFQEEYWSGEPLSSPHIDANDVISALRRQGSNLISIDRWMNKEGLIGSIPWCVSIDATHTHTHTHTHTRGPRRKTEQKVRPAATWGAQLSPPPIHSVNASPSGRLAGLQTATESQ